MANASRHLLILASLVLVVELYATHCVPVDAVVGARPGCRPTQRIHPPVADAMVAPGPGATMDSSDHLSALI